MMLENNFSKFLTFVLCLICSSTITRTAFADAGVTDSPSIGSKNNKREPQSSNRNTSVVGSTANRGGPFGSGSGGPYDPNNPNSTGGGIGANGPGNNGYGGQGTFPGNINCSVIGNTSYYDASKENIFPSKLLDWLVYNKKRRQKVLYSEEKGFLLPSNPSEQTKFNLGMDADSEDYAWESGKIPYDSLFYSFRTKAWVPLTFPDVSDNKTILFISYSDCTAIRAEEKRLAISLAVGSLYKDGKYIYGIKAYKDGTVKLLLGNPKLIKKDKPIDLTQVSNSIIGEETIKIQELWRQVSIEAAKGIRSDTNYLIVTPSKECMGILQSDVAEENFGCKNYTPSQPSGYGNPFGATPLDPNPTTPNPGVR